jgi:hypothetical protein
MPTVSKVQKALFAEKSVIKIREIGSVGAMASK